MGRREAMGPREAPQFTWSGSVQGGATRATPKSLILALLILEVSDRVHKPVGARILAVFKGVPNVYAPQIL